MNVIVVYPGRFQPFHRGHLSTYEWLTRKFGDDAVYVGTSDVTAPLTSPFSYDDKLKMAAKLGVPTGRFVRVKNPYQAQEITSQVSDPDNTALIFAISEKDMGDNPRFKFGVKRDGSPSYMQPLPENLKHLKPLTEHAYVVVTPTVNFKIHGRDANSASEIRKMYIDGNDQDRDNIIQDLYGSVDPEIKTIFDRDLLPVQKANEFAYLAKREGGNLLSEHRVRLSRVFKSIMLAERRAAEHYSPFVEDLAEDYLDERRNTK